MRFFPKIEKITKDISIVHFSLMFGYKLFSLYFPLFLVTKGFSLPEVGCAYLLICLPLAVFSPLFGFLNHKINPGILICFGVIGYAIYSLGMILIQTPFLFYFWQVFLGISASLFFVSSKAVLMGNQLKNNNRSFGWFYSVPFYASATAPVVGGLLIYKFGFTGVFASSLAIHTFNAIFAFKTLRKKAAPLVDDGFSAATFLKNQSAVFKKIAGKEILSVVLISFSILFLAGFYRAFFVLFLKESLYWPQSQILLFISASSLLFCPISLFIIRRMEKFKGKINIFKGAAVSGFGSILLGCFGSGLGFVSIFFIDIFRGAGNLMANAGRSGFLTKELKLYPEEAGALDTIFSPLGTAMGSFIGGLTIGLLGFENLFILGGVSVLIIIFLARIFFCRNHYYPA